MGRHKTKTLEACHLHGLQMSHCGSDASFPTRSGVLWLRHSEWNIIRTAWTWSIYKMAEFRHSWRTALETTPTVTRLACGAICMLSLQPTEMMTSAHRPAEICCWISSRHGGRQARTKDLCNKSPCHATRHITQFPVSSISQELSVFRGSQLHCSQMFYEWALTWSPLEADTSWDIIKFDPIIQTVTKQFALKRPVLVISSSAQQVRGLLTKEAKKTRLCMNSSPFSLKAG